MVTKCVTLGQVQQEAIRRVKEDGTARKIYIRPNGNLVLRLATDPIFVSTAVEPVAHINVNGEIRGFRDN